MQATRRLRFAFERGDDVGKTEAARPFAESGEAINFSLEFRLKDVQLLLSFGDLEYDLVIRPFGPGKRLPERPASKRTQQLLSERRKHRQEQQLLRIRMDLARAERKDATKRFPFKRKPIAWDGDNGELPG